MSTERPAWSVERTGSGEDLRGAVHVDGDRRAALLVSVWVEDGTDTFRCRLTAVDTSPGAGAGQETTLAVTASPSETIATISEWLDDFLDRAATSIDTD